MSIVSSIDWEFLEAFFGGYGKIVTAVIAFVIAVISLGIAIYRHRHARTLERILGRGATEIQKLERFYRQGVAALKQAQETLEQQKETISEREQRLDDVRNAFNGKEHDLWCIHPAREPDGYNEKMKSYQRRKPIIMVANLKGGVGKTTLTANLAAYFNEAGQRVLLVDVDYQGSLSNMMLSADGVEDVSEKIKELLVPDADASAFELANHRFTKRLKNSSIITTKYEFASFENKLMIEYLLQDDENDRRYRLAKLLLNEQVSETFDIAIIDAPPRLTAGTINAFCASTHLLVPTLYDKLSAEAVGTFLDGARKLRASLNHEIDLLGVIGMLTYQQDRLIEREENARRLAISQVSKTWSTNHYFFERHIPRKSKIAEAAGEDIAFYCDATVRHLFEELGAEISGRLDLSKDRPRTSRRSQSASVILPALEEAVSP
jgi:cellulose biosynthesis protein BcsQ